MICACTETSSADTGSSSTISCGSQRQRAGHADPLALAAGELVRVAVEVLGREARRGSSSSLHPRLDLVRATCRGGAAAAR